jgi:hypothetical protein
MNIFFVTTKYFIFAAILVATPLLVSSQSYAAPPTSQELRQFRFMSFALRDEGPSLTETNDFLNEVKSLNDFRSEWSSSSKFDNRLYRFFNDIFGSQQFTFVLDTQQTLSMMDGTDVYDFHSALTNHTPCNPVDAVTVEPWWLPSGQTIKVCPNVARTNLIPQAGVSCANVGANGIGHADCGCGKNLVGCIDENVWIDMFTAVKNEIPNRGVYSYQQSLSWSDFLASNEFIGNKYAYYGYLISGGMAWTGDVTDADIASLRAIPTTSSVKVPSNPNYPERAGIITNLAFMQQYNNFRSRISKLTNALLCKDVDGTLNTDGTSTFYNPNFTAADIAHGEKEGCASCHYGMDNMGSTLFGWSTGGFFKYWESGFTELQKGHVFGQTGTGPEFLMRGFTERASGFHECMAKRFWEDLTGETWEELSTSIRSTFISSSSSGPRSLIQTVVNSDSFMNVRQFGAENVPETITETNISFVSVNQILEESCSGSGCHSQGTNLGSRYEYINSESNFQQAPVNRVTDGSMPIGKIISDQNRQVLVDYLSQ